MKPTIFSIAAFAALISAAPLAPRAGILTPSDANLFNFALTLEHLEDVFYRQAIATFSAHDFTAAGFPGVYEQIQTISADEAIHVALLAGVLDRSGIKAVDECTYNFGVTDVKSFLATASILEHVGTSAYTGALAELQGKLAVSVAGTIATIEARHSSILRYVIGQEPVPQPFDNPLSEREVFTLAAPFIVSCPATNPPLGLTAFPTLTASSTDATIVTGSTVHLSFNDYTGTGQDVFAAFIVAGGAIFVDTKYVHGGFEIAVPEGIAGQSYVVLSSCNNTIAVGDDKIIAGPTFIEVAGVANNGIVEVLVPGLGL